MENVEVKIRNASVSDCAPLSSAIATLIEGIPYYNDLAKTTETAKFGAEELESKIIDDPLSAVLATVANDIVGFCLTRFDDYLIWIEWFGVTTAHRGSGISTLLLDSVEEDVKKRKCHKIWCDIRTVNEASIHILTKRNYRRIVTIPNHWYKQDFILWEKEIR